jgi:RsiW-degrading membrane proteinase PrsW (M82 family)
MGLLASFLISFGAAIFFASFLYWLDRYEKEPLLLLGGVFLWGAIVAAGGAFLINSILGEGIFLFSNSDVATTLATGSVIAPLVEEILKGLAVLGVFLVFHAEFDSVLDGIIYAGVAALGFAATENTYYIYNYGYLEASWSGLVTLTFIRVFLVGWQHPFYTAFTGIGLAFARLTRNWFVKLASTFGGLGLAIFTHSVHNTLESFLRGEAGLVTGVIIDWSGWLIMFAVILWATRREERALRVFLADEVQSGVITPTLYHTASSAWRQTLARSIAFFTGRYRKTARFYQVCGEYAHKRQQYALLGDEGGNLATIQALRTELACLSPDVQV